MQTDALPAGNCGVLSAVTAPLATGKENLAQNAEAIFAQATKLTPLLGRAEQVMQKHQESKGALTTQSGKQITKE